MKDLCRSLLANIPPRHPSLLYMSGALGLDAAQEFPAKEHGRIMKLLGELGKMMAKIFAVYTNTCDGHIWRVSKASSYLFEA